MCAYPQKTSARTGNCSRCGRSPCRSGTFSPTSSVGRISTARSTGAAAKARAGRRAGGAVHRPAGPQLRRDLAPVAADHKRKARRHRGAGHAAAGHAPDRPRFDGHVCGGPCAADPVVCGADRAREDPPAPERGHRGGQAAGRALRPPAQSGAAGLCPRERAVAVGADQLPSGGAGAAHRAGHVFALGKGNGTFRTQNESFSGRLPTYKRVCPGDTFVRFFAPKRRRMHLRLLYTVRTKMSAFPRAASSQGRFPPKGKAVAGRLFASGRKSGNRRKP